jgi:ABC-type transporter Mla maintaining outer membrane lipid asymmetry permease subunit MlaE
MVQPDTTDDWRILPILLSTGPLVTTLTLAGTSLLATTSAGRQVVIGRVTANERFQALRTMGISEGRAAAVASGLAVLKGMK